MTSSECRLLKAVKAILLWWSLCVTRINLGLMMAAGFHSTSCRGPISGGLLIALKLTGMSLSITIGGPMLYMPRLCISLVSEAGMCWWTPSLPISGGRPWSRLCSAQVLPIIGAGGGLVCESVGKADMLSAYFDSKQSMDPVDLPSTIAIRLPVSLPLPSGHVRWSGSCWVWIPMVALTHHWECFLFFWRRQLRFWLLVSLWYFGGSFVWVAFLFAGEWLMSPQFQRVHLTPQHPIIDQFP